MTSDGLSIPPFLISPSQFNLELGDSIDFSVHFSPTSPGHFLRDFIMECDNTQSFHFTVHGEGWDVIVKATEIDEAPIALNPPSALIQSPPPSAAPFQADAFLASGHPFVPLIFPSISVRAIVTRTITLQNFTPITYKFYWEIGDLISSCTEFGASSVAVRSSNLAPHMAWVAESAADSSITVTESCSSSSPSPSVINPLSVFRIEPMNGQLGGNERKLFSFSFSPVFVGLFVLHPLLIFEKIPATVPSGEQPPLLGSVLSLIPAIVPPPSGSLSLVNVPFLHILVRGEGAPSQVQLFPAVHSFAIPLLLRQIYKKTLTLTSSSSAPVPFKWNCDLATGQRHLVNVVFDAVSSASSPLIKASINFQLPVSLSVTPDQGSLQPGESVFVEVSAYHVSFIDSILLWVLSLFVVGCTHLLSW